MAKRIVRVHSFDVGVKFSREDWLELSEIAGVHLHEEHQLSLTVSIKEYFTNATRYALGTPVDEYHTVRKRVAKVVNAADRELVKLQDSPALLRYLEIQVAQKAEEKRAKLKELSAKLKESKGNTKESITDLKDSIAKLEKLIAKLEEAVAIKKETIAPLDLSAASLNESTDERAYRVLLDHIKDAYERNVGAELFLGLHAGFLIDAVEICGSLEERPEELILSDTHTNTLVQKIALIYSQAGGKSPSRASRKFVQAVCKKMVERIGPGFLPDGTGELDPYHALRSITNCKPEDLPSSINWRVGRKAQAKLHAT